MKKNLIASVAFVALSMLATSAYADNSDNGSDNGSSNNGGSQLVVAATFQRGSMEVEKNSIDAYDNDSHNKIDDNAFQNATGAFQVQQNTGTNVQQQGDVTVAAIIGCNCGSESAAVALAVQSAKLEIERNCINAGENESYNRLTDNAFQNAKGAFSVQQNTGTNVQQQSNVTVAAIIAK